MKLRAILLATISACSVSACAADPLAAATTPLLFKPAMIQHDLVPAIPLPQIQIGSTIGPVLPQIPSAVMRFTAPTTRVQAANHAALHEPTSGNYLNAVQVYPYSESALYRLYAAPQQVSDVALQPGETLSAISAGDTVRWAVGDTSSGSGAAKQVHVLVKPFAANLKTNLVILTDKRTYHLELQSTDRVSMAAVSWSYPGDGLIAERAMQMTSAVAPVESGLALENLNFRYNITGDSPAWKPVRAFDDGHKVYIEFPEGTERGEAPPLFIVGEDGTSDLVNYRVRANYYIVDRLFAAAELRLGQDKQQVVRIMRTDPGKPVHRPLFGE
jgi:P-type conjugative transfer protein TrbG